MIGDIIKNGRWPMVQSGSAFWLLLFVCVVFKFSAESALCSQGPVSKHQNSEVPKLRALKQN